MQTQFKSWQGALVASGSIEAHGHEEVCPSDGARTVLVQPAPQAIEVEIPAAIYATALVIDILFAGVKAAQGKHSIITGVLSGVIFLVAALLGLRMLRMALKLHYKHDAKAAARLLGQAEHKKMLPLLWGLYGCAAFLLIGALSFIYLFAD